MNIDKLTNLKVGALFCEAGTGKTKSICEIADNKIKNKKVDFIYYILPASLKWQTKLEVAKWSKNSDKFMFVSVEGIGSSFAIYEKIKNSINNKTMLVVDESLKVKNIGAKRTQRVLALSKQCNYKFILNGTPISKNYYDLFTQMYFLSPKILGYNSLEEFYKNHFKYWKHNPKKILEACNIEWLINKISPYVIEEKLNLNILKNKYMISCFFNQEEINKYNVDKDDFIDKLKSLESKEDNEIYALFVKLQQIPCKSKMDNLKELVNKLDNVIVVCRYIHEMELIKKEFSEEQCDIYNGSVKELTNKKILIISLQAGAFGLNLQHYNNMVFFSKWFDYAIQEQMEHRIYRKNQNKDVNYYHLINVNNPVEEMIENCLYNKNNILNTLKKELKKDKEWKKQLIKMFELRLLKE